MQLTCLTKRGCEDAARWAPGSAEIDADGVEAFQGAGRVVGSTRAVHQHCAEKGLHGQAAAKPVGERYEDYCRRG